MRNDISQGIDLVIDRYSYSGVVYSAAKDNPSLTLDWAWNPEIGLPRPDMCLFLSLSPEEAAKRGGFGLERYETDRMQVRVRQLYQTLLEKEGNDEFCVVDAGGSMDDVEREVLQKVLECIRRVEELGPLRTLKAW